MTPTRWAWLVVCACLAIGPADAFGRPKQDSRSSDDAAELAATRAFAASLGAYVALQKAASEQVSAKPTPTSDAAEIAARRAALAARLAAARSGARQGDMFSKTVSERFRQMIRRAFRSKERRAMRRTMREDDHVRPVVLRVNDVYPESIPMTTMPPTLLRALPALPAELTYRIVGSALVLLDVRTNLIVDFMPDAIPGVK